MRPPSYYNSIVKSNTTGHSYSSPDYDSAPRTSSQQLRSSLSNPSSSNYVSRSHLPFVPQSTLVAHCFTGVGSSTRPYGSGSSSGSSYRAGGGSAASSYISSTSSLSSAYSANSSSSLSSSSRPQSSNYRPYSASTTTNYSLTTPSSSSTLLRSSYLSPSSTTSKTTTSTTATARYRPTVSSSYYKPIRLRERPLLTQISRQIASPTPPPPSTSTLVDRISSPVEPTTIHSHSSDTNQEATSEQKANRSEQADRRASNEWSSDIGRNISRNKYLIKFREIDKQPSHARSTSPPYAEATIELPPPTTVPTPEPAPVEAADRLQSTETKVSEPEEQRSIVVGSVEASVEPTEVESTKVVSADKKKKKKPEEMKQPITTTTNNNTITTSEEQTSVKKAPLKREKKNVKLRLRPVGSGTLAAKTAEVEATAATTIIDKSEPDKEVQLVAAAPVPAMGPVLVDSSSVQRTTEQAKPAKAKRPVKPKEDKENRTELASSRGDDTTTTTSTTRKSSQPNDATTIKTKKRTKKESDEQQQQQQQMVEPKSKPIRESAKSGKTKPKEQTSEPTTPAQPAARSLASDAGVVPTSPKKAPTRIRFREYNYDDFNFLSVLGHGGWGFVILAELKEHDACFAVKCIKKITIVEDDDYDSIMIERKVLALGNIHPFICKLFCTFETEGYLFFVMEYCPGGDLMFHVQHEGKFTESRCRFYAAEIICAIRFLHNRHIIYRDLKLDNILLDARGHIRLVDFGMCQCRTYREEMLPSNFCGTPEYISPEIIKGVPYNHSVDWWSFGVLLYEMAVGKMPFRGNDENELLWNVCYEQIHYPMFLSKELTSLLKLLLEREPSMRMGMATCKAGDIYDQPYFRGVDWRAVEEMRVEPPFVPEVKSSRDVSNFDSDFTESTCELSPVDEGTLAKIDQKQFQQFPYTNPDIFIFDTTQGHTN